MNSYLITLVLVSLSLVVFGCAGSTGMNAQAGYGYGAPQANTPYPMAPVNQANRGTPVVVYGPAPAPRPVVAGPGGNIAALSSPIAGCDAPFRVDVVNNSDKYLQLMVDGNPLPINGVGTLPYVPPNTRLYICLAHPGQHTLQGVAFVNRLGQFAEVSRFQKGIVGQSYGAGTPYNVYRLGDFDIHYMEQ